MASLSGERCEPRVAMMALAKVTWEDGTGASYAASVTIEDTSSYGACIRTRAPITIGSRLKVDWRGGKFSGVAKYCRQYRDDFIVGIQRDVRDAAAHSGLGSSPVLKMQNAAETRTPPPVAAAPPPARPQPVAAPAIVPPLPNGATAASRPAPAASVERQPPAAAAIEPATEEPSAREAKTSMLTKWLRREPGQERQERKDAAKKMTAPAESNDGKRAAMDSTAPNGATPNRLATAPPSAPGALLQLDDIYRAKGIIGLRMGYGIHKVVEMLGSDHARDLPPEMKRASVLMALDVAGVPLDDVLRDAERRLEALNTYEADQEKQLAEYESRKVQENAEIQAEMERVTAHYLERRKHNMDEVSQMRAPFSAWQAAKQAEAQRISEAVELCTKNEANSPVTSAPRSDESVPNKLSRA